MQNHLFKLNLVKLKIYYQSLCSIGMLILNFISTLGLIISNKYIFKTFNLNPIRLVWFHQIATSLCSIISNYLGIFKLKAGDTQKCLVGKFKSTGEYHRDFPRGTFSCFSLAHKSKKTCPVVLNFPTKHFCGSPL